MATITEGLTTATESGDQCVVLRGVDWDGYEAVLEIRGERRRPRMLYLDGRLSLVSPSARHEHLAERLGAFVMEVLVGLRMPFTMGGSTTLRDPSKEAGAEGDRTFYLGHWPHLRVKKRWEAGIDPIPDLVIEAVHTHHADDAVEIYRRLGVPEVWVCDSSTMQILVLQGGSRYAPQESGAFFPFLTREEVLRWVNLSEETSDAERLWATRQWVASELQRRVAAPPTGPAAGGEPS